MKLGATLERMVEFYEQKHSVKRITDFNTCIIQLLRVKYKTIKGCEKYGFKYNNSGG